jgi:RNA polymerase-binding transcription factor DksA
LGHDGLFGTLAGMTQHFDEAAARRRLEAEQQRVAGLIGALSSEGLDEEAAAQVGDNPHVTDPADQGSETFEREKDVAILEQLENDLAEIEAALQRLDDGTYGVDEVTGDPIAPERLEAYPIARTNIDSAS